MFRVGSDQYARRDEDPRTACPPCCPSTSGSGAAAWCSSSPASPGSSTRRWREIRADDVNTYLREISGEEMTAKDFRTWHGTVRAAEELAAAGPLETTTGRKKAVSHAMKEVAELLGNTPAVARSSYVDPRVVERFEQGRTVDPAKPAEQAVLDLLAE
jgi:hypothetical protein